MELSAGLVGEKALVGEKLVGVREVLGVGLVVGQGDDGLGLGHLLLEGLVTLVVGVEGPQERVLLLHRVWAHLLVPLPHDLLLSRLHVHVGIWVGLCINWLLDGLLVDVILYYRLSLLLSFSLRRRNLMKS